MASTFVSFCLGSTLAALALRLSWKPVPLNHQATNAIAVRYPRSSIPRNAVQKTPFLLRLDPLSFIILLGVPSCKEGSAGLSLS